MPTQYNSLPIVSLPKMKPTTSTQSMTRRPLTERSAQGRTQQPRRRIEGSHKRAYGKGGTASSRAVLYEQFFDENKIEEQMSKMSLGQAVSLLPSETDAKPIPPAPPVPVARRGKDVETVPAVDHEAAAYTSPLRAECLGQKDVRKFSSWAEELAGIFKVVKVAEGSYGEVFQLEKRDIPSGMATTIPQQDPNAYGGCIFKLIPLRAKSCKTERQTSLDALVREVKMLKRMDPIPGFARFRDVTVLQGPYPLSFTEAYNDHKARKPSGSQSQLPSKYSEKQLWAMIEMDDGGKDLEVLKRPSAFQIFDIFWLTCCTLSYAEDIAEFEHRDLHIGNICIKSIEPNATLDSPYRLNLRTQAHDLRPSNFGYSGLRTTIIDYTLSRAKYAEGDHSTTIYDPMKVLSIFIQHGKTPEASYQFTTYRKMRDHAIAVQEQSHKEDPSRENKKKDKWERFMPRTNVMWLECLLWTLLFRSKDRILMGSNELTEGLQRRIYEGLKKVLMMLGGPSEEKEPPKSAKEVVERGDEEGLLTKEDLLAIKEILDA